MTDSLNNSDLKGKNIILLGTEDNKAQGVKNQGNINNFGSDKAQGHDIENNLNSSAVDLDTLDESISETLKRDFTMIYQKLLFVLIPKNSAGKAKSLRSCKKIILFFRGFVGPSSPLYFLINGSFYRGK